MINVSVTVDTKAIDQMLSTLERKQVPFATAYALTQTAKAAQAAVKEQIGHAFDRPTRFTQGSVYVKPAKKNDLNAEVKIQDTVRDASTRPVQWLYAEVEGGARKFKGLEVLLQAKGQMPRGWYAVPTTNAPLDQFGNVSGATINKILSQLQARNAFNTDKNETSAARKRRNSNAYRGKRVLSRYFAVLPNQGGSMGRLPPGLWERLNTGGFVGPLQRGHGSISPIFLYVPSAPRYSKRLDFHGIVRRTVASQLLVQFQRGIELAQSTAKPS